MKVFYICECCDECVEELEFTELEINQLLEENLTGEGLHDIIKMQMGTRTYYPTICDDCLSSLDWEGGADPTVDAVIN